MRFFEICAGDDAGSFLSIDGIKAHQRYQYDIEGPLSYLPGKKRMGDCFSFLSCADIFSEKVILELGWALEKWGTLSCIMPKASGEKYFLFSPIELAGIDMLRTEFLKSVTNQRPIAIMDVKFSKALAGNEIFQPGLVPACSTLYSEEFIVSLKLIGARGYYLKEWSENSRVRKLLNRDLTELVHTKATMKL
jgi:hypothetical protein